MTTTPEAGMRPSATHQLIDQAREVHRRVTRSDDLASEGGWTARQDFHGHLERHMWFVRSTVTPTLASAKPYVVTKAITESPDVAALLTFVSTALPQLCDLADEALAARAQLPVGEACQKCGGKIEGWTCQGCGQLFREDGAGSLIFDPWVDGAVEPLALAEHIATGLGGQVVDFKNQDKPCGRWSCNIHTPDWTKLIDLSVMPAAPVAGRGDLADDGLLEDGSHRDCKRCQRGEVYGMSLDDGSWFEFEGVAGGANKHGLFGKIYLIEHHADGSTSRREYVGKHSPAFVAQGDLAVAIKALEPFARAAGKLDGLWVDGDCGWNDQTRSGVTVGDIRRAAEALRTLTEKEA